MKYKKKEGINNNLIILIITIITIKIIIKKKVRLNWKNNDYIMNINYFLFFIIGNLIKMHCNLI